MADAKSRPLDAATYRFTRSFPLVVAYCVAQCLLYSVLGILFPETEDATYFVVIGHIFIGGVRVALHMVADQPRALVAFSWCWVATYAAVTSYLWVANNREQMMVGLPLVGMVAVAVLQALQVRACARVGIAPRALTAPHWRHSSQSRATPLSLTSLTTGHVHASHRHTPIRSAGGHVVQRPAVGGAASAMVRARRALPFRRAADRRRGARARRVLAEDE